MKRGYFNDLDARRGRSEAAKGITRPRKLRSHPIKNGMPKMRHNRNIISIVPHFCKL